MSKTVTVDGKEYDIPEKKEAAWGTEMTEYLFDLGNTVEDINTSLGSGSLRSLSTQTEASLVASETITPTKSRILVKGDSGPVTLDSETPIKVDGIPGGADIFLVGMDNTYTVKVPNVSETCSLNGHCVLAAGEYLHLILNNAGDKWVEVSRSH